jgi:hypothetical protein
VNASGAEVIWGIVSFAMLVVVVSGMVWFTGYLKDTRRAARKILDRSESEHGGS